MSAPETPRTVELQVVVDFLDAWRFCPVASSPKPSRSCLENAGAQLLDALDVVRPPVDAERERLLDLLEDALLWLERIPPPEEEVRALGRGLWDETLEKSQDVLREYGRLGKEES